jgi:hypothetical protein
VIPSTADQLREQEELQHTWGMLTVATAHTLLMLMTAASRMRPSQPELADRVISYFEEAKAADTRCV